MKLPAPGFVFKPPVYVCQRAPFLPSELCGRLDKPFWADAPWTDDFTDIEGDVRPVPRFRTRAKMLWDDEYLYVGAELYGNEIWAHLTERDSVIFYDNDFEVFIDPDGDCQEYVEFEMNALNTVWDLLLTKQYLNGGTPVDAFDIQGLKTAVYIDGVLNDPSADNKMWSVEIAFPLKVLNQVARRNYPAEGRYWRVGMSRVQWLVDTVANKWVKRINPETGTPYPEDNWTWPATGGVNMHLPETWSFVFFTDATKPGKRFEIPPHEFVRWQLRKLYYAQNEYCRRFGKYTSSVDTLAAMCEAVEFTVKPWIEHTSDFFSIRCEFEGRLYVQYSDGRSIVK
ncbi:MAG: carbohydrate-binding family 9-like protein [Defluviitaleaceae bacterium]|nr:carbohydrate-binding family 9-like protein [Defluviitaleaceae bacterium]